MKPVYDAISRDAILSVKVDWELDCLGKKMAMHLAQELDSRLSTRKKGACIKHLSGKTSVKMDEKFGRALLIATTTNDMFLTKHNRKREYPDGFTSAEFAPSRTRSKN